jgi:hypothetical protein
MSRAFASGVLEGESMLARATALGVRVAAVLLVAVLGGADPSGEESGPAAATVLHEPPFAPWALTSPYEDVLGPVEVEGSTGSLLFGLGVNSDPGLTGSVVLGESDFKAFQPPLSLEDFLNGNAFRPAVAPLCPEAERLFDLGEACRGAECLEQAHRCFTAVCSRFARTPFAPRAEARLRELSVAADSSVLGRDDKSPAPELSAAGGLFDEDSTKGWGGYLTLDARLGIYRVRGGR